MAYKRAWYGRPNPLPLGWEAPERPVMRSVAGHAEDLSPSTADAPATATGLISVALPNMHWERILKMFTVYGQAHGDAEWRQWRKRVREVVMLAINRNTKASQPAVVGLAIEDWQTLFRYVKQACDEGPTEEWRRWFAWLSRTMSKQIRGQAGGR